MGPGPAWAQARPGLGPKLGRGPGLGAELENKIHNRWSAEFDSSIQTKISQPRIFRPQGDINVFTAINIFKIGVSAPAVQSSPNGRRF